MFRNLCIYELEQPLPLSAEALEEQLRNTAFSGLTPQQHEASGWVAPLSDGDTLAHAANGALLLCRRTTTKLLPPKVVRDALSERVEIIEAEQHRRVRRRERDRLKDEVILSLLPRAFDVTSDTLGYVDTNRGLVIVDASTWSKAEGFVGGFRETIGTLPVRPLSLCDEPGVVLTSWVKNGPPQGITLTGSAKLRGRDGEEVSCKRVDLTEDAVAALIESGKQIMELGVGYGERSTMTLRADSLLKGFRYTDVVKEQATERDPESETERLDADFTLLAMEVADLVNGLRSVMREQTKAA